MGLFNPKIREEQARIAHIIKTGISPFKTGSSIRSNSSGDMPVSSRRAFSPESDGAVALEAPLHTCSPASL
jgi:hypothetical protein